jgi:hypothetical protein
MPYGVDLAKELADAVQDAKATGFTLFWRPSSGRWQAAVRFHGDARWHLVSHTDPVFAFMGVLTDTSREAVRFYTTVKRAVEARTPS